jgi:hypothetical protein
MANQWFRLYSEFSHDPKVQMLSEVNQRRLIMLFCIRCNGNVTLQDEQVAFQLRISMDEWLVSKATFIDKNFINSDNEVLNWDKRQFVSDSSAERVAKHRERMKQSSNVTVTSPEQNRTDTEHNITEQIYMDDFDLFWMTYPKKVGKEAARKAWIKANPNLTIVLNTLSWQKESNQWFVNNGKFIPNPATWINQHRWDDEQPREEKPF